MGTNNWVKASNAFNSEWLKPAEAMGIDKSNTSTRQLPTNELIRQVLGEEHSIPLGWRILVKIYEGGDYFTMEDGSETLLERPDNARDRDKFQYGVGQVLMMGDFAFKGPQFHGWDLKPQVGDYVLWEKYSGSFDTENGINLIDLPDYQVLRIVQNPSRTSYYNWRGQ